MTRERLIPCVLLRLHHRTSVFLPFMPPSFAPPPPQSPLLPLLQRAGQTCLLLALAACLLVLTACQTPKPEFLGDHDFIPVGSRIEFWVDHDELGWMASNIFIGSLPRPMTGAEARRWAEGVGNRDAGLRWTRYYLRVSPPVLVGEEAKVYHTAVFTMRRQPYEMTGRPPAQERVRPLTYTRTPPPHPYVR